MRNNLRLTSVTIFCQRRGDRGPSVSDAQKRCPVSGVAREYNQAVQGRVQLNNLKVIRSWSVIAAMVAAVFLPMPAPAQSAGPVRVAVVGLEHGHVSGFLYGLKNNPEIQLVAIVEPDATLAATYEKKYSLDPSIFYTAIDPMVAAQKPQALLVFTSVGGHRAAIEAAARHHLPVMVEKPLAMSLADAIAIRATARKAGIPVLVNYETTWYASNLAANNAIQQGKLGDLRKVVIHDGHEGPKEINVQPEFLKWLNDPQQNGQGALYDFGCYGADLMTWFMRGATPLSVTAVGQTDKPDIYGVYDDATIIVRYPKAQAVLMPSWNWPFSRKDSEVYGATGYMITVGPGHYRERLKGESAESSEAAPLLAAPPLTSPEDSSMHYLAAVVNGQLTPKGDLTSLDTNMIVMQILDAARESAKTGKTVILKPLPE
jgi:glucose-fructose oxidoreductase